MNTLCAIVGLGVLLDAAGAYTGTDEFVILLDSVSCDSDGLTYIKTEEECELAASAAHLDLADKVSFPVSSTASYAGTSPYGCYYKTDPGQLYLNVLGGSTEGTEQAGKRAICKNPTFVSTTTTTTPAYNAEFSAHNYIEYRRGTLPLILVASHGGTLEPDTIPERTYGTLEPDKTTLEIVLMVADEIETLVPVQVMDGVAATPHVIISHLARSRMDGNRDFDEATQGAAEAEVAWTELHNFILRAQSTVASEYGKGLQVDFHAQGHSEQWIELGFGIDGSTLDGQPLGETAAWPAKVAEQGNTLAGLFKRQANIDPSLNFDTVLRGAESFGALLLDELAGQTGSADTDGDGVGDLLATRVVPSPDDKGPANSSNYYQGGFITQTAAKGVGALQSDSVGKLNEAIRPPPQTIEGVQIELPQTLRLDGTNAPLAATVVAKTVHRFFSKWYDGLDVREVGNTWPTAPPPTPAPPTYADQYVMLPDPISCQSHKLIYVENEEECELAAAAAHLNLTDTGAFSVSATASYAVTSPFGCYYKTTTPDASKHLYLNVLAGAIKGTERYGYRAVCKNPTYVNCDETCNGNTRRQRGFRNYSPPSPPTPAPPTYTAEYVMLPDPSTDADVSSTSCESFGLAYIATEVECELAASAVHLALVDTGAFAVPQTASYARISPHGCYFKTLEAFSSTADSQRLYLNVLGSTEGTNRRGYRAVCRNPNFV